VLIFDEATSALDNKTEGMTINTYLIISLGSIGRRHLSNLRKLDKNAKIIILRHQKTNNTSDENVIEVNRMEDALSFKPTIAIIASPAVFHVEQALVLLRHNIHLFIEKPLSHNLGGLDQLQNFAKEKSLIVMIGYVLRFSPVLKKVKSLLEENLVGNILSVSAHYGQYLPNWRPKQDYQETVSAKKELGGGVLLEISHEFDYLCWLFGDITSVVSNVVNTNTLNMNAEDRADILIKFNQGFSGFVHLNCLEKKLYRVFSVNGSNGNIFCDFNNSEIKIDSNDRIESIDLSQDEGDIYLNELSCFLECVKSNKRPPISLKDGIKVMKIVEAVKLSSNARKWVDL